MSVDLKVTPSTLEVDFDKNLTELYKAITDEAWDTAITVCRKRPIQAATWVVRHYDDDDHTVDEEEKEIMWRFLPIHSACARRPPAPVIAALIKAYPDGPRCIDDQGMYALHYACGNQASRDVIRQLLLSCPEAAGIPDPRGMLPIHYLACWGPSSVAVLDMILVAYGDVINRRDDEGNTPLDLATEGDYPHRNAVIEALKRWGGSEDSLAEDATIGKESIATMDTKLTDEITAIGQEARVRNVPRSSQTFEPKKTHGVINQSTSTNRHPASKHHHADEEKKDDESVSSTRYTDVSNRLTEVVLQKEDEISKLKKKLAEKDSLLEQKESQVKEHQSVKATESDWKVKCDEIQIQLNTLTEELEKVKSESSSKSTKLSLLERELEDTKLKLKQSNEERDGLRITLGDLMDQHEKFKKKSGNMNERLGSLSVSLESMMEQQSNFQKIVKERNAAVEKAYKVRQQKLQELVDMEQTIKYEEAKLESSLLKQNHELEAIAAVIKAARDC